MRYYTALDWLSGMRAYPPVEVSTYVCMYEVPPTLEELPQLTPARSRLNIHGEHVLPATRQQTRGDICTLIERGICTLAVYPGGIIDSEPEQKKMGERSTRAVYQYRPEKAWRGSSLYRYY